MRSRKGYLIKRGKTYSAVWYVEGKKFVKTTGQTDEKEANKVLAELVRPYIFQDQKILAEHITAHIGGINTQLAELEEKKNPPTELENAWKQYDKNPNRPESGERTLEGYKGQFERFVGWCKKMHPEVKELRDVGTVIAEQYAHDLGEAKFSASTYNQHLKTLALIWGTLATAAKITLNPWAWDPKTKTGLRRRSLQKTKLTHKRKAMSAEEINRLLSTAPEGDLRDLLSVLAFTGQRLVDVVMLKSDSIDMAAGVVSVFPQKVSRKGKQVFIPIFPQLRPILHKRIEKGGLLFPELAEEYLRDAGSTLCKRIQAVFASAGFTTTRQEGGGRRGITEYGAHSLRHGFVTLARSVGYPDALIMQITGHASEEMVDHYTAVDKALVMRLAKTLAIGKGSSKLALPDTRMVSAADVRKLAKSLTADNWQDVKKELMEVTK